MKDSTTIFQDKKIVSVFSHLNHEIAILGSLSRFGSKFIYLTQSYGEERLNETVAGLQRIGLENGYNILPNQESTYYERFLKADGDYFVAVAEDITQSLSDWQPDIVLCDAVEYFNPAHDITLPLVMLARKLGKLDFPIFEVPILYQGQRRGKHSIQGFPEERRGEAKRIVLTESEVETKLDVFRNNYRHLKKFLVEEAGIVAGAVTAENIGTEIFFGPSTTVPLPNTANGIRYEWRGEALRARGAVEEVITYRNHYLPVVEQLHRAG